MSCRRRSATGDVMKFQMPQPVWMGFLLCLPWLIVAFQGCGTNDREARYPEIYRADFTWIAHENDANLVMSVGHSGPKLSPPIDIHIRFNDRLVVSDYFVVRDAHEVIWYYFKLPEDEEIRVTAESEALGAERELEIMIPSESSEPWWMAVSGGREHKLIHIEFSEQPLIPW